MEKFMQIAFGPSWVTTLIGYAAAAVIEAALAIDALPLSPNGKMIAHVVAALVAAFGRAVKDGRVTGGTTAATPEAKDRLAGGFVSIALILRIAAVAIIALLAISVYRAHADEPKFGGCMKNHPDTCFAPSVSVNVVAMSIKTGDLTTTFDPGLGYGATFFSSQWYKTGVSGTVSFPEFIGKKRVQPALVFSFAEYARIGVACPLYVAGGFRENGQILLGFGADFGASK